MSKIITLLFLLVPALLFAQATKKVVNKNTNETYYVLKSDKSVKHGNYEKTGWNGKPLISGYYKNGVKDSIWTFYDQTGQVCQKYDYRNKKLIFDNENRVPKPGKSKILKGPDTIDAVLDSPALYIGGTSVLYQFIADSVQYPDSAKERNIMGTVKIAFLVDTNGTAVNYHIVNSVVPCLDNEALKVAKELPDGWIPGVLNGKKVEVAFILPIKFSLR